MADLRMPEVNNFQGAGRLTRDVELTQVGASPKAKLALAISERYKTRDGEKREDTTFVDVEVWKALKPEGENS